MARRIPRHRRRYHCLRESGAVRPPDMVPELVESAHRVAAQLAPVAGGTLVKGLLVSRAVVAAAECGAAVPTEEGTCNRAARPPAVSTRTARPASSTSGDGGGGGDGQRRRRRWWWWWRAQSVRLCRFSSEPVEAGIASSPKRARFSSGVF